MATACYCLTVHWLIDLLKYTGMRILVNLLLDTLPMLGNVLLLCFFVFFIFGIIGVQLWAGLLRNRCYLEENFTLWVTLYISVYIVCVVLLLLFLKIKLMGHKKNFTLPSNLTCILFHSSHLHHVILVKIKKTYYSNKSIEILFCKIYGTISI